MKYLLSTILLVFTLAMSCEKSVISPSLPFDFYPKGQTQQTIKHKYYTLSYSEADEQAEWVAYILTAKMPIGAVNRTDDYRPDPMVTTGSADLSDYTGSGYDRGHLCPAEDMSFSLEAMSETFYLSNMSPQDHSFNAGIWSVLESQVRDWAISYDSLYVITGPVLTSSSGTIGTNMVKVPQYYYKVILDYSLPEVKMIAFLLPNEKVAASLDHYAVTTDSVEIITGIDFFPALHNDIETSFESTLIPGRWSFSKLSLAQDSTIN